MRRPLADTRRRALRVAAIAAPLTAFLLVPAAALADDTPGTAKPLGVANSLLIFLVAPVGVFLVVALLTLRPGSAPKAQRYRPGKDWTAAPAWSGVQPDLPSDAATGAPQLPVMDGAREQEHASTLAEHGGDPGQSPAGDVPAAASGTASTPSAESGEQPPSASGGSRGSW